MKNLSILDKLLFFVNSILAAVLLISFLSYYISPQTISIISIISLIVPYLIMANALFVVYWLLKFKRAFLISLLILLLGYQYITKLYGFEEKKVLLNNDIKVMSYNVRMFNVYNWIEEQNVDKKIYDFITQKNPDILCIQEYHPSKSNNLNYPYSYVKLSKKNNHFGHAIFSKYKIINKGALNFTNSANNAIFADIVVKNDTLRVYNVHLESLKINPKTAPINQKNSERLKTRLENSFKKQVDQANQIIAHQQKTNLKTIIMGDFNNTAFSWVYNHLKTNKNDAFEIAGKGFGTTYDFALPLRIDFILTDKKITVNNFKTFDVSYSDHFPVMARVNFK